MFGNSIYWPLREPWRQDQSRPQQPSDGPLHLVLQQNLFQIQLTKLFGYVLVMAAGLSRPGKSREGPGTGQDLETLKVPGSCGPGTKEVQKSRDFF
jgi:hypothetical protein